MSSERGKISTLHFLKESYETCIKPALGPAPKKALRRPQWEMAAVHTMLINALINVYELFHQQKARTVPKSKHNHFVLYALQWWAQVEEHHQFEEEEYYPLFPKNLFAETVKAEHALFHGGLTEMNDYLVRTLPEGTPYGLRSAVVHTEKSAEFDGERLVAIIESFVVPLIKHLETEIQYLDHRSLRDAGMTEDDVVKAEAMVQEHIKVESLTLFLVYGCLHTPRQLEFPPIPAIVKYFLVPWVLYWPYRYARSLLTKLTPTLTLVTALAVCAKIVARVRFTWGSLAFLWLSMYSMEL